jgi:hypothetical protein
MREGAVSASGAFAGVPDVLNTSGVEGRIDRRLQVERGAASRRVASDLFSQGSRDDVQVVGTELVALREDVRADNCSDLRGSQGPHRVDGCTNHA